VVGDVERVGAAPGAARKLAASTHPNPLPTNASTAARSLGTEANGRGKGAVSGSWLQCPGLVVRAATLQGEETIRVAGMLPTSVDNLSTNRRRPRDV
jgi:hypothetical protein